MNETENNEDTLEFDGLPDEDEGAIITEEARRVYTDQGDPEIDSLYGKYKRGKLILQPDFQRRFVWDRKKCSRLIESVLLDIPLPVIYLSEEVAQDSGNPGSLKEYVIDGQQRLTAFFSYIDNNFPDNREFKLTGLNIFKELNGKKFAELDEGVQDRIKFKKIRTITFRQETGPDLKFEIFERLNTGAVALNDQELRNCIYRGSYNNLLKKLCENNDFRALLGLKGPEKRMRDVELVLRFAAFHNASYLGYKPSMRQFLNRDMDKNRDISPNEAKDLEKAFKDSVATIRSMLGKRAFKRFYRGDEKNPNGRWEPKKFNASLYDILMWSFARVDRNVLYRNLDSLREALINLMTSDHDFIDSIELSTSSLQAVTKRFDKWRYALEEIAGVGTKEPRCFSKELKTVLFEANNTCSICGQEIQEIDDAAIDHIEQYWTGGRTIPENARLTHRYCNWSRPRRNGG
jgi:hypothetical protein